MSSRLVRWLAILACLWPASLLAQDPGQLLPAGQSSQRSPLLERYALERLPSSPGGSRLSAALREVDQGEPALRLRGARDIELYRTLAPSVALIVTDKGWDRAR